MKNPEKESPLDLVHQSIAQAPAGLADEYKRTANPWVACFISRMFTVETYLATAALIGEIPSEEHTIYRDRIDALRKRARELADAYPNKDDIPAADIQEELFQRLNVFEEYHGKDVSIQDDLA